MLYVHTQHISKQKMDREAYYSISKKNDKWKVSHGSIPFETKIFQCQGKIPLFGDKVVFIPGEKSLRLLRHKTENAYFTITYENVVLVKKYNRETRTYIDKLILPQGRRYHMSFDVYEPLSTLPEKEQYILRARTTKEPELEEKVKTSFIALKKEKISEKNIQIVFSDSEMTGKDLFSVEEVELMGSKLISDLREINPESPIYLPAISRKDYQQTLEYILTQDIQGLYTNYHVLDYLDSVIVEKVIMFVREKYFIAEKYYRNFL